MTHYIYKKERKNIIPVLDKNVNKLAKDKLEFLYSKRQELKIPSRFLDSWNNVVLFQSNGDVEKANSIMFPQEETSFALNNSLNDLTAREWLPETITVFTQKGLGASNQEALIEKQHPAPFSFQDVNRLLSFFTKENDSVLDPFSGVASTVKACSLSNRYGVGIELNFKYHQLGLQRIETEIPNSCRFKKKQKLICGNSINEIQKFRPDEFDFIITSPPYWDILDTVDYKGQERIDNNLDYKYSNKSEDLANINDYDDFLDTLSTFFDSCSSILKKDKYMCIIVSDFRKKDKYYTFHADLAKKIEDHGNFILKGVRILYQKFKGVYPYGYPHSFVPNVHHQNVLIFQNNKLNNGSK